ncbi:MAG: Uma2 family endonuclease [Sinobacteraceae bacterium]|nr:Uma2 family endonuclease [Nevskiaceae bacterium]
MSAAIMTDWLPRHRITVDEYHRMAEVGLLAPDARVELIEGEIIDMAPIGDVHGTTVDWLTEALVPLVKGRAIVRVQGMIRLSQFSEPQPDIALLKPHPRRYIDGPPAGDDTLLVIEVSDSSLRYDREIKVSLYARHRVPEVWIVDVPHKQIHFHRALVGDSYSDVSVTSDPSVVTIKALPDLPVDLSGMLFS